LSALDAPRQAFQALRRTGNRLANLLESPILVLGYHRVADLERDTQELAVRPENFRLQMRLLKRRCDLYRLDDAWPRSSRPAAIVTFDDGYADNATTALPILEEEEVPATFFVSVDAVERGREFWWDELERLLLSGGALPARVDLGVGSAEILGAAWPGRPASLVWTTRTEDERVACYRALHRLLRGLQPGKRDHLLQALRAACGGDDGARPTHRPLTPGEVARLGKSPWARVGAHGVTHTPFSALTPGAQRAEMEASRDRLRAWSGTEVTTFSFPFGGRRDFTAASVRLARGTGFRRIAANIPGQTRRWPDPFVVPRFLVRDWEEERFAAELTRFETA
jgi:peptidoglycan/xylan/chitin deacetylase (PgdA/CDA1 family)